jgi:hypothetical protein
VTASDPVRIRCPRDTNPARHGDHLAVDVRLPVPIGSYLTKLSQMRCPCGAPMVVVTGIEAVSW